MATKGLEQTGGTTGNKVDGGVLTLLLLSRSHCGVGVGGGKYAKSSGKIKSREGEGRNLEGGYFTYIYNFTRAQMETEFLGIFVEYFKLSLVIGLKRWEDLEQSSLRLGNQRPKTYILLRFFLFLFFSITINFFSSRIRSFTRRQTSNLLGAKNTMDFVRFSDMLFLVSDEINKKNKKNLLARCRHDNVNEDPRHTSAPD